MASDIPLNTLLTGGQNSLSTSRSGFQSYEGSKTSSQRPLNPNGYADRNGISQDQFPSDNRTEHTAFTENTFVPRRKLGFIQVTSLMINGCLGNTWFFTTPCYVLALVRSKRICLVLWAVGAIYSALGMTVFLEYGIALPFNGGPLVYLDEVFHRPRLLATVVFAIWWILFAPTEAPSRSVAQTILSLAGNRPASELEDGMIKFTAIVIQTVVCLMLFFAPRLCFAFNTMAAFYKITLMLVIFIAGMAAIRGQDSGLKDFNVEYPGYSSKDVFTAFVYIAESYQGWDNANYVSGEAKDYKTTLKWAGITTISILSCLNMLVTVAFFSVSDFAKLTDDEGQANSAFQFAQTVFKSTRGMQAATGLSSFLSLVFVTYTTAKVKQAIAWQRIIPFSQFFGRQSAEFDSPGGGLVLHWIFTVIPILALGKLSSDRQKFFNGLYQTGYEILVVFMSLGLFRLKDRMRLYDRNWNHVYLNNRFLLIFVAVSFAALNIVIMVMIAIPHKQGTTPRFYWPVTMGAVAGFGIVYWGVLRLCQANDPDKKRNIGSKVGFQVYIYEQGDEVPEDMKFPMYEAALDGSRRRLQYKVSGPLGWCFSHFETLKNFLLRTLAY